VVPSDRGFFTAKPGRAAKVADALACTLDERAGTEPSGEKKNTRKRKEK
jgi:hypothetical protein